MSVTMPYSLRTLLILLAVLPPVLATLGSYSSVSLAMGGCVSAPADHGNGDCPPVPGNNWKHRS